MTQTYSKQLDDTMRELAAADLAWRYANSGATTVAELRTVDVTSFHQLQDCLYRVRELARTHFPVATTEPAEPTLDELVRATRGAVVALRNDLGAAQSELRDHALAGFGSVSNARLSVVEQHVANAELLIRDLAAALFQADQARVTGCTSPVVVREFVAKWRDRA